MSLDQIPQRIGDYLSAEKNEILRIVMRCWDLIGMETGLSANWAREQSFVYLCILFSLPFFNTALPSWMDWPLFCMRAGKGVFCVFLSIHLSEIFKRFGPNKELQHRERETGKKHRQRQHHHQLFPNAEEKHCYFSQRESLLSMWIHANVKEHEQRNGLSNKMRRIRKPDTVSPDMWLVKHSIHFGNLCESFYHSNNFSFDATGEFLFALYAR